MFTQEEVKSFIIKLGNKWFFPDFSNKITWYVVTLGAGFILVPEPIKLFFLNWLIDIFNLNSGVPLELPDLEASTDYTVGIVLIVLALAHNLGHKYFSLEKDKFDHAVSQELKHSDLKLLEKFLLEFPSDCSSAILLKDHDFGNSFNRDYLKNIDDFTYRWNGAEYKFMNKDIDEKRAVFHSLCKSFLVKIAEYTSPVGASNFSSVVPDHLRGEWDFPDWVKSQITELNEMATEVYRTHQEFILYAKNEI
ncbi:hypothetical protein [Marinomonas algicola]|uniref:hypothetical protein n=1 Tax=Marinomonas algicola TaxID=2773454 RepID=UPI00174BC351|nr:hypothetical protein [Marinomonas algicola]